MPSEEHPVPVAIERTAFVRLGTNLHSVPAAYAGRTLALAGGDCCARLLDGQTKVAEHPRSRGRRPVFEKRERRAQVVAERRAARDRPRAKGVVGIGPMVGWEAAWPGGS